MALPLINLGTAPNNGTGDPARTAYGSTNGGLSLLNTLNNYAYSVTDQNYVYTRLQVNGAVFNGTHDDGPALQNTINDLYSIAAGRFSTLDLPPGAKILVNSVNGSTTQVTTTTNPSNITNCCLDIPSSMSINGNKALWTWGSTASAAVCAIFIHGDPSYTRHSYGMSQSCMSGIHFTGPGGASAFTNAAICLDQKTADYGPSRYTFDRVFLDGISNNGFAYYNNTYMVAMTNVDVVNTPGYAIILNASTNSGERNVCFNSNFYNGGTAIKVFAGDIKFIACSFDYNTKILDATNSTSQTDFTDCHYEAYAASAAYSAGSCWLDTSNANRAGLTMKGGNIHLNNGGSGTTLTSVFNTGTASVSTSYQCPGTVLYSPTVSNNGPMASFTIPLNNPSAGGTGKVPFVYNP